MTPQPWSWLILAASMASVMEPIWFTFRSSALHAFFSIAAATRFGFVTWEKYNDPVDLQFDFNRRQVTCRCPTENCYVHVENIGC